jgi:hypothetical protein
VFYIRIMLVLVASTGQEVEVECDCDTTLGALQTELEEKTEVPTNDQLLVFAGARLAGKETALSKYGLPMDANGTVDIVEQTQTQSRFVVLYRKSELRPVKGDDGAIGSAEPECAGVAAERESAGDGENETFPEYAAPRNTYEPLPDDPQSSVTNENLLPWFHRAFSAQVRYASRRLRYAETQLAKCGLLVRETRVSEIALRVAVGTLGEPFSCFMKKQRNFTKEQEKRIEKHESALAGFDGDMETLRLTRLNDPAPTAGTTPSGNQSGEPSTRNSELGTQQPVRTTLMDCVPYGRIVDWCGACRLSHGLFKTKLEDLATEITELTRTAEDAMSVRVAPFPNPDTLFAHTRLTLFFTITERGRFDGYVLGPRNASRATNVRATDARVAHDKQKLVSPQVADRVLKRHERQYE